MEIESELNHPEETCARSIPSSRAVVSRGNAKKDDSGRLVVDLPHDGIVQRQGNILITLYFIADLSNVVPVTLI